MLLVLLSTYLFVQLIELPTRAVAFAYAVVAGVTCYFHYFGVLIPVAHFAVVLALPARRRAWRMLAPAAAIIVVIVAPILWLIHAQDTGHISWVQAPSWRVPATPESSQCLRSCRRSAAPTVITSRVVTSPTQI